jgi:hypothetical protein
MSQQGFPIPTTYTHKNQAKISDGRSVKVTVPASTEILVGDPTLLDGFFGFAVYGAKTGAAETADMVLNIEDAEFITDKIDTTKTFSKGASVYWDASAGKLTDTTDGTLREVGRVTRAKDAANTICLKLAPQNVPAVPVNPVAANTAAIATADLVAAAGASPTKAEYDLAVAMANGNKAKINAILAALKAAGLMTADS